MTTIYVIGDSFSAGAELEDFTFKTYQKFIVIITQHKSQQRNVKK